MSFSAPRRCLQHASKVLSTSKDLPPPDVHKLAQLAHLHVTEQQVDFIAAMLLRKTHHAHGTPPLCAGERLGAKAAKHIGMVCAHDAVCLALVSRPEPDLHLIPLQVWSAAAS